MNKKYSQYVLIEFSNTSPCVELFTSDTKEIDMEDVIAYLVKHRDFDDSDDTDDAVTFVDAPDEICID